MRRHSPDADHLSKLQLLLRFHIQQHFLRAYSVEDGNLHLLLRAPWSHGTEVREFARDCSSVQQPGCTALTSDQGYSFFLYVRIEKLTLKQALFFRFRRPKENAAAE